VLLDCYSRHAYSTETGWECLWCHFDGITARHWYQNIVSRFGNVLSLPDPQPIISKLGSIYDVFSSGSIVREPLLSKYLTDILTAILLYTPSDATAESYISLAEKVTAYISEHFAEKITVSRLASLAGLSDYHFIRIFKRQTGFTPHEYILNTRMNTARYLLKNSTLSMKDICFSTGFSCESVFCSAFKRTEGITPAQYREHG
jgi:AraC-like DNA-binding protein